MKINLVSFRDREDCEPVHKYTMDRVVGGADRPCLTTLFTDTYRSTYDSGAIVAILFRLDKYCPCAPCVAKTRDAQAPLLTSYERLSLNPESADVVFEVGNDEILAHKLILTTRYDYFEKMFSAGMTESATNRVVVEDVESDVFRSVLRFIYCGTFPEEFDTEPETYLAVAEKYGMEDLKSACSDRLEKSLTACNLFQYVSWAGKFRIRTFKLALVRFVDWKHELPKTLFRRAAEYLPIAALDGDEDLKLLCAKILEKTVEASNVVEALILSHDNHCHVLKRKCFETIRDQRSGGKEIGPEAYLPLHRNPDLMAETFFET